MSVYFNEHEPFAAAWLGNLFPAAKVDTRSVRDVQPADLVGFTRVHLFGGIGGWEYALALTGWPDDWPVWTGSCPCQPFSGAGKRKGTEDERHLWPEMFRLVRECSPAIVLGEQVASGGGLQWLDGVFADLEGCGYACGAADLPSACVGSPNIRQRLWWVAHAGRPAVRGHGQPVGAAPGGGQGEGDQRQRLRPDAGDGSAAGGMGHTLGARPEGRRPCLRCGPVDCACGGPPAPAGGPGGWDRCAVIPCRDGKWRRVSAEPGDEPLAPRIPLKLGQAKSLLGGVVKGARRNRVGRLKGYGNAINPWVAALFVRNVMEILQDKEPRP